jgi:hypothetical protein
MVTERNDEGTESTVEVAEAPPSLDETPVEAVAEPEVEQDLSEPADTPIGVTPQTESQTEPQSAEGTTPESGKEFRKYQSATDKRIAEMETQLQYSEQARALAEQQTNVNTLQADVAAYGQELTERYINRGLDDTTAQEIGSHQANLAREAYIAKVQAEQVTVRQRQVEQELNSRTQLAKAYELSSQYGIPYAELQDFPDPQSMERHAKALSRISKLEKTVQQVTPGQQMNGATPAADVAPTNAEEVLDRYNAGDAAITTEMARAASQKLGLTIFG